MTAAVPWGHTGRVTLTRVSWPVVWLDGAAIGDVERPTTSAGWVPWLHDGHGGATTLPGQSWESLDVAVLWLLDRVAPGVAATERMGRHAAGPVSPPLAEADAAETRTRAGRHVAGVVFLTEHVPDLIAPWRHRGGNLEQVCLDLSPALRGGRGYCTRRAGHTGRHAAGTGERIGAVWGAAS